MSEAITEAEVAALQTALAEMTPGPWRCEVTGPGIVAIVLPTGDFPQFNHHDPHNARGIVALVNAAPRLLAERAGGGSPAQSSEEIEAELAAVGDRLAAKRPHFPIASSGRGTLTPEERDLVERTRQHMRTDQEYFLIAVIDRLTREGTPPINAPKT